MSDAKLPRSRRRRLRKRCQHCWQTLQISTLIQSLNRERSGLDIRCELRIPKKIDKLLDSKHSRPARRLRPHLHQFKLVAKQDLVQHRTYFIAVKASSNPQNRHTSSEVSETTSEDGRMTQTLLSTSHHFRGDKSEQL